MIFCLHRVIGFQVTNNNPKKIMIALGNYSSSSSSYRAGSTDIPDPLSPLLPIVHRPR